MSHNEPHLESKKGENINKIAEIKKSLYVDDYISGGINATWVRKLKQLIINIVGEAQFIFHKWYSNIPESEDENNSKDVQACAKVQLGVESNETKILGLVKLAYFPCYFSKIRSWPNKEKYPSDVSTVLQPSWFSSTNIVGSKIDLLRSAWAWDKMGSTTTRSYVEEVEQMDQQSTGKNSCPTRV